MLKSTFSELHV